MTWRRQQVTNLVRRVSIEARAINPRIKISAALIPWGEPPGGENDFEDVEPMQRVFQNWHQWLKDGLIDLAVPMNYARETDERVRGWFDGWIRWEKRHTHGRQLAVGLGAYRNTPAHILDQISRVRRPDGGHHADGVSFFSYASPQQPPDGATDSASTAVAPAGGGADRLAFLAEGNGQTPPAFARPAPVPAMPWIDRPQVGWIAGIVHGPASPADTVRVRIKRTGFALFRRATLVETDGNGYYGLTNVKPGRYRVWLDGNDADGSSVEVVVEAGKVTRADLSSPLTTSDENGGCSLDSSGTMLTALATITTAATFATSIISGVVVVVVVAIVPGNRQAVLVSTLRRRRLAWDRQHL